MAMKKTLTDIITKTIATGTAAAAAAIFAFSTPAFAHDYVPSSGQYHYHNTVQVEKTRPCKKKPVKIRKHIGPHVMLSGNPKIIEHTVKKGQTYASIAEDYGLATDEGIELYGFQKEIGKDAPSPEKLNVGYKVTLAVFPYQGREVMPSDMHRLADYVNNQKEKQAETAPPAIGATAQEIEKQKQEREAAKKLAEKQAKQSKEEKELAAKLAKEKAAADKAARAAEDAIKARMPKLYSVELGRNFYSDGLRATNLAIGKKIGEGTASLYIRSLMGGEKDTIESRFSSDSYLIADGITTETRKETTSILENKKKDLGAGVKYQHPIVRLGSYDISAALSLGVDKTMTETKTIVQTVISQSRNDGIPFGTLPQRPANTTSKTEESYEANAALSFSVAKKFENNLELELGLGTEYDFEREEFNKLTGANIKYNF